MARRRTLDEVIEEIEHARPVHPLRVLIAHHFYLDSWVSSKGGLSLAMFNALLFVPFMMFLFFYPVQALIGLGVVLVVTVVLYEAFVIWRRHTRVIALNPDERVLEGGSDQRAPDGAAVGIIDSPQR